MFGTIRACLAAGVLCWSLGATAALKNGGFDAGMAGWTVPSWLRHALTPQLDKTEMPGPGKASLRLEGQPKRIAIVYQSFRLPQGVREYRISFKMKTANISNWSYAGCYMTVDGMKKSAWSKVVATGNGSDVSTDWTEYKGEITLPKEVAARAPYAKIYLQLSDGATGTAWFDDVALEPKAQAGVKAAVAEKTSAPAQSVKESKLSGAVAGDYDLLFPNWEVVSWIRNAVYPSVNAGHCLRLELKQGQRVAMVQRLMSIRGSCDGGFRYSMWVKVKGTVNPYLVMTVYPLYTSDKKSQNFVASITERKDGWVRYVCDFMAPADTSELRPQIYTDDARAGGAVFEAKKISLVPLVTESDGISLFRHHNGGKSGIFAQGEIPFSRFVFKNGTSEHRRLTMAISFWDYFGKPAGTQKVELTLPARSLSEHKVYYPAMTKLGYYAVEHRWHDGKQDCKQENSFVVTTPIRGELDKVFGITFFADSSEVAESMRLMGAGTKGVRIVWNEIEDHQGAFHWEDIDQDVDACLKQGIKVIGGFMPTLGSIPARYRDRARERIKNKQEPYDDVYLQARARFVDAAVRRYRSKISDWALIGEINLLKDRDPYEYDHYVVSSKAISVALRKANPQAKLVGIGCSGGDGRSNPRFPVMRGLWKKLHGYLDGVGLDQYTSPSTYGPGYKPADSESGMLREIMLEALDIIRKDGKQALSIDEKGSEMTVAMPVNNPYAASAGNVLAREYVLVKSVPEIEHWLYYTWRRWRKGARTDFGLWLDEKPRHTVAAYAAVARVLQHARFVARPEVHRDIPCYVFRRGNASVAALWLSGSKDEASLLMAKPAGLKLLDVQGNPVKVTMTDGRLELKVSESPLYVESDLAPEALAKAFEKADVSLPEVFAELNVRKFGEVEVIIRNLTPAALTAELSLGAVRRAVSFAANETKVLNLPVAARNAQTLAARKQTLTVKTASGRSYAFSEEFKLFGIRQVCNMDEVKAQAPLVQLNSGKYLDNQDFASNGLWTGPEDCSAELRMGYNREALFLNIRVTDEFHWNGFEGSRIWAGDSIQFAFDPLCDAKKKKFNGQCGLFDDDYLFAMGLTDKGAAINCDLASSRGKLNDLSWPQPVITRDEKTKVTEYSLRFPWYRLESFKPMKNHIFAFNFIVLDSDRKGQVVAYWLQLTPGIAGGQRPEVYRGFVLE